MTNRKTSRKTSRKMSKKTSRKMSKKTSRKMSKKTSKKTLKKTSKKMSNLTTIKEGNMLLRLLKEGDCKNISRSKKLIKLCVEMKKQTKNKEISVKEMSETEKRIYELLLDKTKCRDLSSKEYANECFEIKRIKKRLLEEHLKKEEEERRKNLLKDPDYYTR